MHACVHVCIFVCRHVLHLYDKCIRVHTGLCVYVRMQMYVYAGLQSCMYLWVCMLAFVHVYIIHVSVYVRMLFLCVYKLYMYACKCV